jgi:hypothetical protein
VLERGPERVPAQLTEEDRPGHRDPDRPAELLRRAEQAGRPAGRVGRDRGQDHVDQRDDQ